MVTERENYNDAIEARLGDEWLPAHSGQLRSERRPPGKRTWSGQIVFAGEEAQRFEGEDGFEIRSTDGRVGTVSVIERHLGRDGEGSVNRVTIEFRGEDDPPFGRHAAQEWAQTLPPELPPDVSPATDETGVPAPVSTASVELLGSALEHIEEVRAIARRLAVESRPLEDALLQGLLVEVDALGDFIDDQIAEPRGVWPEWVNAVIRSLEAVAATLLERATERPELVEFGQALKRLVDTLLGAAP